MTPLDCVNPLQGTGSRPDFSTGNTYPAVGVPRGMTYWTPQTSDGRFVFERGLPKLAGIRATHSPSPWMADFGHFDVMPGLGPIGTQPATRAASYRVDRATFAPHRFAATLLRSGIDLELAASDRCGVLRLTFPPDAGDQATIVLQAGWSLGSRPSTVETRDGGRVIVGVIHAGPVVMVPGFACYVVAELEGAECVEAGTLKLDERHPGQARLEAPRAGAYVRLRPTGPVTLRIATSFISEAQARLNLEREVAGRSLEQVADATAQRWQRWLAKLDGPGAEQGDGPSGGPSDGHAQRVKFYTALYRVGLFPTTLHEPDAQGRPHHHSPYDGRVHSGVAYTNNGFWDTYRTVYPLLALIDPEGYGEIVEGFLNAYRQAGWLPKWASPGYRRCMVGTHLDSVIAEAVAHGIEGFDVHEAYEAIRRNAFEPGSPDGLWGRLGLEHYLELGYVPHDVAKYSVCRTLDAAYCDWCVAQVARHVGRDDDARVLLQRSQNYRHLWHAGSGFMRPRLSDGSWVEPWSEWGWGEAYIEGGPWQHSWTVPHDLDGLAELAGGRDALADKLEAMFAAPPRFTLGHYGQEIHEMSEMALARDRDGHGFGQYAHSNQPSHAILWQLDALGRHGFARRQLDRVLDDLYTVDDLPGDEDNGEMAAWYLLSVLGRYRLCPGASLAPVVTPAASPA